MKKGRGPAVPAFLLRGFQRWPVKATSRWAACLPVASSSSGLPRLEQTSGDPDHREMVADELPILYTKRGCPWCHEAVDFLDSHGIGYKLREVTDDTQAMEEMRRKSGQTKAPTLDWKGEVLADFGVDELVPFLRNHDVKLEDS